MKTFSRIALALAVASSISAQEASWGFVENRGQYAPEVLHTSTRSGVNLTLVEDGFWMLKQFDDRGHALRFIVEDARSGPSTGLAPKGFPIHYLSREGTRTARTFRGAMRPGIVEGVDLVVRARNDVGVFEYDVAVDDPGRLDDFVIRCEGAEGLRLRGDGALVVDTSVGPLVHHRPIAFALDASARPLEAVACRFELLDDQRFRFRTPDGDAGRLWIDPSLVWGTYLGGSGGDGASALALAPDGAVVVAGNTTSLDFPTTPGPFVKTALGIDTYVSRFSPDGSALLMASVFQTVTSNSEGSHNVTVTDDGDVVMASATEATDFPTTAGSYSNTFIGGVNDTVILRLASTGDALVFATYFGGSEGGEVPTGLIVEDDGSILVAGRVCAGAFDFPTTPGVVQQTSVPGGFLSCDAFLTRLSGDGASVLTSTRLGGSDDEFSESMAVLPDGDIVIGGWSDSDDFPLTPAALFPTFFEKSGFISRLSPDFTELVASTYFPIRTVALIPRDADHLVVGGAVTTQTSSFFTPSPDAFDTTFESNGPAAAVIAPDLDVVHRATYLDSSVGSLRFDADAFGVVMVGTTAFDGVPTTPDAVAREPSTAICDAYVTRLDPDLTTLLYGSYYGGPAPNCGDVGAVALTPDGDAILGASLVDVPTTPDAFDPTPNGTTEGVVARFRTVPAWQTTGAGLAGTAGEPRLVGYGTPAREEPIGLGIFDGLPSGTATLVIGLDSARAPLKGGVLVPTPDLLVAGLPLDASGHLEFAATWPAGIPAGLQTWYQVWIADVGAPKGFAATNGLTVISN